MGKWKYQKEKGGFGNNLWVQLENGIPKKLKISDWQFIDNPDSYTFKASVIEEDEHPADKFWTVWDYDLKELLKKKLKVFKPNRHKVELIITKKGNEDDFEEIFELEILTKR